MQTGFALVALMLAGCAEGTLSPTTGSADLREGGAGPGGSAPEGGSSAASPEGADGAISVGGEGASDAGGADAEGASDAGASDAGGADVATGGAPSTSQGGAEPVGGACDLQGDCDLCADCAALGMCSGEFDACAADMECLSYVDCALNCGTDDFCFVLCELAYPAGSAIWGGYATCAVCDACPIDCDAAGSGCP